MKRFLSLFLLSASFAFAVPVNVQRVGGTGADASDLTASIAAPTGKTIKVADAPVASTDVANKAAVDAAVLVETNRATAAEALKARLAGGNTFSGDQVFQGQIVATDPELGVTTITPNEINLDDGVSENATITAASFNGKLGTTGDGSGLTNLRAATQASLKFVFEGDSLTASAGDGGIGATNVWPVKFQSLVDPLGLASFYNVATSGETVQAMVTQYTAQVYPYRPINAGDVTHLLVLGGTNDIAAGRTAAEVYDDLKALWALARANGILVTPATIPPRGDFTVGNGKETVRLAVNSSIVGDTSLYDRAAVRLDTYLTPPSDADIFNVDQIHQTVMGARMKAALFYASYAKLDAFTFLNISGSTLTSNKTLTVAGQSFFGSSLRSTGFSNFFDDDGLEVGFDGVQGIIQAYDHDTNTPEPLFINYGYGANGLISTGKVYVADATIGSSKSTGAFVVEGDAGVKGVMRTNVVTSEVATGTPPIFVESTTLVANLHAANSETLQTYTPATLPLSTATQTAIDTERPFKLRRLAARFYELGDTGSSSARVVSFGDSLAFQKPQFWFRSWHAQLGGNSNAYPATATAYGSDYDSSIVAGTFATSGGDGYTYWPTGPLPQLTTSSSVKFVASGVNPTFSAAKVYYVKESGAGTFNVVKGGSTVATLDASNGSVALGVYEITQGLGQAEVRLDHVSGGNVRIIKVVDTGVESGVRVSSVSVGGLALSDAISSAQSNSLFSAFLADFNPDVFTFEMNDTPLGASITTLGGLLDAAAPTTDKIFIASTPSAAAPTSTVQRDELRSFCRAGDASYYLFDGWTPVSPYQTLVDLGWEADGVHPTFACQAYLAGLFLGQFSENYSIYGKSAQAVNNVAEISRFARNSEFVGPGDKVTVETDGSFGYDWNVRFPRTLSFSTRGSYGTPDGVIFQVSGNEGVNPNILPPATKYGSLSAYRVATAGTVYFNTDGASSTANPLGLGAKSLSLKSSTSTADGIDFGTSEHIYRHGTGAIAFTGTGGVPLRFDLLDTGNVRLIHDGAITIQAGGSQTVTLAAAGTTLATFSGGVVTAGSSFSGPLTGNVTGNVSGTAPAGSLTGTTLAANVVTSSLTSTGTVTSGTWNSYLTLKSYTVATLPAAGTAGRMAYVTDALAPTYNGAAVGGGAVVVPVFDNGTIWTTH